jgi:bifunctional non-homologous end joining protein LigD
LRDRRGREATRRATLYAFNLIEHKDVPVCPFLDRKDALARLLHSVSIAASCFSKHVAKYGPIVFARACRPGAEGIVSKRADGTYRV